MGQSLLQSHPGSMEQFLEWGRTSPWAITLITFLGVVSCLRMVFGLLKNLHDLIWAYILPRIWPVDLVKTYGKWAVVTGCTGGIGRAYVLALAARGMDVVLVARSMEKLEALEAEVKRRHGCRVLIIQADFTDVSVLPVIVSKLKEEQVEVGILVNNVGILGPGNLPFLELDLAIVKDMPTVNITAATYLCHQLLPAMVAKGKGAVINIASMGSYCPGPYLAEYIATKHYMHNTTQHNTAQHNTTKQNKTKQNKTKQNKTKQNNTTQTKQNKTKQNKTKKYSR